MFILYIAFFWKCGIIIIESEVMLMLKIMTIICFVTIAFIFLFMAYLLDNKDKWHIDADGQIKFSKKGLDNKSHRCSNNYRK